jgi:hypothetical protein
LAIKLPLARRGLFFGGTLRSCFNEVCIAHHLCLPEYHRVGRSTNLDFVIHTVQELNLFLLEGALGEGCFGSMGELLQVPLKAPLASLIKRTRILFD